MYFLNLFSGIRELNDSEFQYYLNAFYYSRKSNDIQFQELIDMIQESQKKDDLIHIRNSYASKCDDGHFEAFINFMNFIRTCNNSIYEYYMFYCERILELGNLAISSQYANFITIPPVE